MPAVYLLATISEDELLTTVIEMAHAFGWLAYHARPARTGKGWRTPTQGDPGFPDLVLARKGRLIMVELKSEKGRLTREQFGWCDMIMGLSESDIDDEWRPYYIWRPSDLASGEIEERLR